MDTLFPPPAPVLLPIVGDNRAFPVGRIFCVGRNYAAHAREMGADPSREPPFFFMKPASAADPVPYGKRARHAYPTKTQNYHYEVELVVALEKGGKNLDATAALGCVFGYAVGLDMTRRDLQDEAKSLKRPWELGKAADFSAPIGPLHPAAPIGHPDKGAITLSVNGAQKQKGDLADMIWSVADQIAYLSRYFELKPGDLIFSGTPEGVGAVVRGDVMEGSIAGLGNIELEVC